MATWPPGSMRPPSHTTFPNVTIRKKGTVQAPAGEAALTLDTSVAQIGIVMVAPAAAVPVLRKVTVYVREAPLSTGSGAAVTCTERSAMPGSNVMNVPLTSTGTWLFDR